MAEAVTVPVRIVNLSDAEALEAQSIENLQRRDVHPMEEAQGFSALLNLEEPKYSIELIAAKTGKNPSYVTTRLKLTELSESVVDAFSREEIGVGHALLLAKLPAPPNIFCSGMMRTMQLHWMPRSASCLGFASSTATRLWQVVQSLPMLFPSFVLWLPS